MDKDKVARAVKIAKVLKQILDNIDKGSLTQDEAVLLYGNLGYSIGAAIAGLSKTPPTLEELEISYLTSPSIANFLMLTGLNVATRVGVNPRDKSSKIEQQEKEK
jgi:hypothetical protein